MGQSWPRERLSWPAGMNRSRPLPTVVCMYVCIKKGLCMGWGGGRVGGGVFTTLRFTLDIDLDFCKPPDQARTAPRVLG